MIYEDANKLDRIRIPILKGAKPDPIYPSDDIIEAAMNDVLNNNVHFPQSAVDAVVYDLIRDHPEFANEPTLAQLGRKYAGGYTLTGTDGITLDVSTMGIYWNQLANYYNYESTDHGITISPLDSGGFHIYGTSTGAYSNLMCDPVPLVNKNGHVFFIGSRPHDDTVVDGGMRIVYRFYNVETMLGDKTAVIVKYESDITPLHGLEIDVAFLQEGIEVDLNFYPMIIDLTKMFGSEYADYIYSLEVNSELEEGEDGDGVKLFRQIFPEVYYPYNSGEIKGVDIPGSYYAVNGSVISIDFPYYINVEDGQYLNVANTGQYPIVFPEDSTVLKSPVYSDSGWGYVYTFMFFEDAYYLLSHTNNRVPAYILHGDDDTDGRILPSCMPNYQIFHSIQHTDFMSSTIPSKTKKTLTSEWFPIGDITKKYDDGAGLSWGLSGFVPLTISYWSLVNVIGATENYEVLNHRLIMNDDNSAYAIEFVFNNHSDNSITATFAADVLGYFSKISDDWGYVD